MIPPNPTTMMKFSLLPVLFLAATTAAQAASTLLHYRVNDTDAATVTAGTVPGVGGSADGAVTSGAVTLSANVPTAGVDAGYGNRSMAFDGASGVNFPGTQQLLNATIFANGGFTYEAWFNFSGGGNVNSIIDYAGTEKLVRFASPPQPIEGPTYYNNSADPRYTLGPAGTGDWHYAAVVFTATSIAPGTSNTAPTGNTVTGNFAFYFDGNTVTSTAIGVTITDFGDDLNRTIAVGAHPGGFAGDFFNGLIYEPRVSLGALSANELLFVPEPGSALLAVCGCLLVALRRRR